MNKVFKFIIFLLFSNSLLAQNADSTLWNNFVNLYDNPYKTFESAKIISFQSSSVLSTNQISNVFIYPFLFGKKLEKQTIDDNISGTKPKQLHLESNHELQYINLEKNAFKNKSLYWYFKGGSHSRSYANASVDAFKLIFKGNTDTTVYNFNNGSYSNINLMKIGGGLFYKNDIVPKPYNLSFGLFATQISNYTKLRTYESNFLHGNEDSLSIAANYDALFAKSGYGLTSELIFNQKIDALKNWGFSLRNFGFANFNKNVTTYEAFGQSEFTGVYINEIGRLGDDAYFQDQLDSLTQPFINKKEKQTKTLWILPVSHIYFNTKIGSNYYQIGMKHSGTLALPVAELKFYKFIKPSFLLAFTGGAIGQYYLNTDINWAINRQWFLQAGVCHLEGLVLSNKLGGLGGNFGLQFAF